MKKRPHRAVCRFARAPRCRTFRGGAGFECGHSIRQVFYGFRLHARVCWPGVVTRLSLCPVSFSDVALLEELTERTQGVCLGDRVYWKPDLHEWLQGLEMLVPYKKAGFESRRRRARAIASIRYRIETVFGQLCERFTAKRVWARDMWHFSSRLLRKLLAHTAMIVLNRAQERAIALS